MRILTRLFLFFTVFLNAVNCYAQWVEQFSGTTAHLYDVEFIDQNTGWSCGDGGVVIKTTNAGTNWIIQPNNATNTILTGIHPVNANTVYAVGYWRTLLKSTNGGTNWQVVSNLPVAQGISFKEVYFINENTGWWVSQFSDYIFRTTDGMNTIDSFSVGVCGINDIYFKDNLNGIAVSLPPTCVLKTTDGGINWNQIIVPSLTCSPPFNQITFIDNYTGYIIPRGDCSNINGHNVYKTTNFGNSWDTIGRLQALPMTDIYGVFFRSFSTGWAAGSNTRIYKTTNGGLNWYMQVTPSVTLINKLSFVTDSIGWAIGNNGKILYTNSSGQFVGINNIKGLIPNDFILYQNYPNPFNPATLIKYGISGNNELINLTVYDMNGKKVNELVNKKQNRGIYEIQFNGNKLASGVYFYILKIDNEIKETKKMLLIK